VLDEKEKLARIIGLGKDVAEVNDLDCLLERILTEVRHFVNADAGSIYIKERDNLKFTCSQNDSLQKKLPSGKKLIYSTFSVPITNESIAGYVAGSGEALDITDVYALSRGVPYTFDKRYDEVSDYRTTSMFTFPLKTHRGDIVGVLQLINATDERGAVTSFAPEDEPLIMHFGNSAAIAIERAQMTRDLILRMVKMAELRDPKETGAHVNRVASYAMEVYETWARRRGIPEEEVEKHKDSLRMAAMLHDVGKIAIPDKILKKPAKLDPEEYEIMKQHTYLGARLFSDLHSDFDEASFLVALNHHERWDGTGYPGHIDHTTGKALLGRETSGAAARGKKEDEIPVYGRLVAIADVYDSLSSRRSYKDAWDEERVLETLKEEKGKHFDPEMIEAFFYSLDVIRSVAARYPDA
jgi:HD-GYP domain-containing protein (c-di-GMP phosphodiesterase class II)